MKTNVLVKGFIGSDWGLISDETITGEIALVRYLADVVEQLASGYARMVDIELEVVE